MEKILIIEDDELIAELDTKPTWPLTGLPENKKQKQKSMMPSCWM